MSSPLREMQKVANLICESANVLGGRFPEEFSLPEKRWRKLKEMSDRLLIERFGFIPAFEEFEHLRKPYFPVLGVAVVCAK